jgi:hypothetical protein
MTTPISGTLTIGTTTYTLSGTLTPASAPAPAPAPAPTPTPTPTPAPAPAAPPFLPALTAIGTGTQATAWAQAILSVLGAPLNTPNVNSLISWFAHEDNNGAWGAPADGAGQNNPLNVTSYSGSFPGVTGSEPSGAGPGHPGNYNFDTPAHGVSAMTTVIKNYGAIHGALMSGVGLIGNPAVSANLSTWSGGGYSSLDWPPTAP